MFMKDYVLCFGFFLLLLIFFLFFFVFLVVKIATRKEKRELKEAQELFSKVLKDIPGNDGRFWGFAAFSLSVILLFLISSSKKEGDKTISLDPNVNWEAIKDLLEEDERAPVPFSEISSEEYWKKWTKKRGYDKVCREINSRWGEYVKKRCSVHGFSAWREVVARATIESAGNPLAVSADSAIGLMGIKPMTAREVIPGLTAEDLKDPYVCVEAAVRYLAKLQKSGLSQNDIWLVYRHGVAGAKEKKGDERTAPYKAVLGVIAAAGI